MIYFVKYFTISSFWTINLIIVAVVLVVDDFGYRIVTKRKVAIIKFDSATVVADAGSIHVVTAIVLAVIL